MQAHYNGHYINVTAIPTRDSKWKCLGLVHWDDGRQGHLKLLRCDEREFDTEADAVRVGLDVALAWIKDGKPEPFTSPATDWR